MTTPAQLQAQAKPLQLQQKLQTLLVLESELASLKPGARIFHATAASPDTSIISHAHGQVALFPGLSKEGALNDVKRQKQLVQAELNEAMERFGAPGGAGK
ncbi:hypothetical protein ACQY0O_000366 [Thecaphora frezii]